MKITGLGWVGTRTSEYHSMVAFLKDVFQLTPHVEEDGFAVFRLPNGDTIEVFGADDEHHQFFTTGPVVGFRVADVPAPRQRWKRPGSNSSVEPKPPRTAMSGRISVALTATCTRS